MSLRRILAGIVFVTKITCLGFLHAIFFDGAAHGGWISFVIVAFVESLSETSLGDDDDDED